MTFQLYEAGREYWTVASRYHKNRGSGKVIELAAVNDMIKMQPTISNPAVSKRVRNFISLHQASSPIKPTDGGGPRYA